MKKSLVDTNFNNSKAKEKYCVKLSSDGVFNDLR